MATVLFSFKKLANGRIMFHGFTGPSQPTAESDMEAHFEGCQASREAFVSGNTIEFVREVEALPSFDGDEIEEWLEALLGEEEDDGDVIDVDPEEH
jgi:hypothetical protein